MPYILKRPLPFEMDSVPGSESDDSDVSMTLVEVYDVASEIGKEFELLIQKYGPDAIAGLMTKVIGVLEQLEKHSSKSDRDSSLINELRSTLVNMENDKHEKAADRQKFEKELEILEDTWRQECRELSDVISRLQEENRRLCVSLKERENTKTTPTNTAEDELESVIAKYNRLRELVDKQRDQIRSKEKDLAMKTVELETIKGRNDRLGETVKEIRKRQKQAAAQIRSLLDDRAELQAQIQDQSRVITALKKQLTLAAKEVEDMQQPQSMFVPDLRNKVVYDLDDPGRPRFTVAELKDLLQERNDLKVKVQELEDELEKYRPKPQEAIASANTEEDAGNGEDLPVQGPMPYEPEDAPWRRKEESGIRKLFSGIKLFSRTRQTPKTKSKTLINVPEAIPDVDEFGIECT
ncbi:RILP-like protein homolog isoform X2 [Artemia franciscana]|uniref:RILP-like protein homolog n=1 Tax=Artemia franciscana TaxID=6661 RepID=A0AA88I380_ARTSF|nr:hypothetical protein QYM36_001726 [Artemia franciscana]KAK2723145.1 hypothetical protein QYM36_001726 [Artemia franciscana]